MTTWASASLTEPCQQLHRGCQCDGTAALEECARFSLCLQNEAHKTARSLASVWVAPHSFLPSID